MSGIDEAGVELELRAPRPAEIAPGAAEIIMDFIEWAWVTETVKA